MKRLLLLVPLLYVALTSSAQKPEVKNHDLIILMNGDSIRCTLLKEGSYVFYTTPDHKPPREWTMIENDRIASTHKDFYRPESKKKTGINFGLRAGAGLTDSRDYLDHRDPDNGQYLRSPAIVYTFGPAIYYTPGTELSYGLGLESDIMAYKGRSYSMFQHFTGFTFSKFFLTEVGNGYHVTSTSLGYMGYREDDGFSRTTKRGFTTKAAYAWLWTVSERIGIEFRSSFIYGRYVKSNTENYNVSSVVPLNTDKNHFSANITIGIILMR